MGSFLETYSLEPVCSKLLSEIYGSTPRKKTSINPAAGLTAVTKEQIYLPDLISVISGCSLLFSLSAVLCSLLVQVVRLISLVNLPW